MDRVQTYTVDASDVGMRLDTLLYDRSLYVSRSAAAKAIESGEVSVNESSASKKQITKFGDVIRFQVHAESSPRTVTAEPIPLDVRFEDADLLVLSKQIGLVCHPSSDYPSGTLVNALIHHCGIDNLCDVQGESDRLGIVHRLDRDTSGLMIAAKTNEAGYRLMEDIRLRVVDRHYLALVHGVIPHETGMIDAPISRDPADRTRMAVRDVPSSREAITTFSVLERFEASRHDNGYTLIDCKLFTGRTHQIRVHMQYARHPIVGDPAYRSHAPREGSSSLGLDRQFLHSYRLAFEHPHTSRRLEFVDNLPRDLACALSSIAGRSMGVTAAGLSVRDDLSSAPTPSMEGEVLRNGCSW